MLKKKLSEDNKKLDINFILGNILIIWGLVDCTVIGSDIKLSLYITICGFIMFFLEDIIHTFDDIWLFLVIYFSKDDDDDI